MENRKDVIKIKDGKVNSVINQKRKGHMIYMNRKLLASFMSLVMILTMFTSGVSAQEMPKGESKVLLSTDASAFQFDAAKGTITGLTEAGKQLTEINIPTQINGVNVTAIGGSAFQGCSSLTSITIPEGVTSIGRGAFYRCSSLASIIIPEGVTSIGDGTFKDCSRLVSITIPEGVTSIGNQAFYGCSSLALITIPEGVTSIGNQTFYGCSSLASITIPEGATSIGHRTFKDCSRLVSITIPEGVTSIGNQAFYGCSSLALITIPEGVTSIGNQAFYGCSSLASITIPEGVTSIGDSTFFGCSSLASITIPEGVTSISSGAFQDCSGLTSITIPNSVTRIENSAFFGCNSLTEIIVNEQNLNYVSKEGVLFNKEQTLLIQYPAEKKAGSYDIPTGVTSIEDYAFFNCSSLASITIPASVMSIGIQAFSGCSSLASLTIPASVTSIGYGTFIGCSSLTDIYFCGTEEQWNQIIGLQDAEIDASVTIHFNTGESAEEYTVTFNANGGTASVEAIQTVNHQLTELPTAIREGYTFEGWYIGGTQVTTETVFTENTEIIAEWSENILEEEIFIFDASTGTITGLTEAGEQLTEINIPTQINGVNVTAIGDYAFLSCSNLVSITISESVTSIGYRAFSQCRSLKEIIVNEQNPNYISKEGVLFNKEKTLLIQYPAGKKAVSYDIPTGVTSIGYNAFNDCSSLASITIPASVTSIGDYAFEGCSSLASITIPESVTSIGTAPFCNCYKLKEIIVNEQNPNYVSEEGILFNKEKTLLIQYPAGKEAVSYDIPTGVTSIGDHALWFCKSLASITIPEGVTNIGYFTFGYCSSLATVTIPEGVTSIGDYTFNGCSSLATVTIPEGVTSIGDYTFNGCSSLTSITIPESVTSIGWGAFRECSSLTDIYFGGTEEQWNQITGLQDAEINASVAIHFNTGESAEEYTVTFNANGGTASLATMMTVNYQLTELPTAIREGYTFEGWYIGGSQVTTETVFTENTEIIAEWIKIVEEVKPEKPGIPALRALDLRVHLKCINDAHMGDKVANLGFKEKAAEVGEVIKTGDGIYQCKVTVFSNAYIQTANKNHKFADKHEIAPEEVKSQKITLEWNSEKNKWELAKGESKDITFKVICEVSVEPEAVIPEGFTVRFEAADSLIKEYVIDSWTFYTQIDIPDRVADPNGKDSKLVSEWQADCIDLVVKPGDYLSGQTLDLDFTWYETHPTIILVPSDDIK